MQLPTISPDNKTRDFIDVFGGYNHNIRIGENEFYDMENLCSDSYPLLAVRKKRDPVTSYYQSNTDVTGLLYRGAMYVIFRQNNLFHLVKDVNGENVWSGSWSSDDTTTKREIIPMGSRLVIIPDKLIVNLAADITLLKNIENEKKTLADVYVQPCNVEGEVLSIDYVGDTVPDTPVDGFVWLDTRVSPASLKKYYGSQATWQSFISSYVKIVGEDVSDLCATSRNLTAAATSDSKTVSVSETLVANSLVGRYVIIDDINTEITANTTSTITLKDKITCDANTTVYPEENRIAEGFKEGDGVKFSEFTENELTGLNQTAIVKKIYDDKKSLIITGSLTPVPNMNLLTARETFTATSDNDYFYFLCDSELAVHYFKDKYIKIGDNEPWLCTDSSAAQANSGNTVVAYTWEDVESITDVIKKVIVRKYGGGQSGTTIHLSNVYKSNAIPEESIADNEDVVYDTEAELKTLEGKTLRFGKNGKVATVVSAAIVPGGAGVSPQWNITLDKSVDVEAGTLVGAVEQVANDKYAVGLKFSGGSGKSIIDGEKSCPTLDTQYVQGYNRNKPLKLSRKMPQMDFVIESQNRLWGCRYGENNDGEFVNEIYCSKLGDPTNWQVYEGISTDSYAASCGTEGEWTGAFNYRGYPTFFKENNIHTVYGSNPPYQIKDIEARGVQKGSSESLAILNEVLFYKSIHGVCAYSGSLPEEISAPLGEEAYKNAVGCSYKGKYYIEMKDLLYDDAEDKENHIFLFVYDAKAGMWHKESALNADQLAAGDDNIFYNAQKTSSDTKKGIGKLFGSNEDDIEWYAETGLFGLSTPDKKYICKLALRLLLPPGSIMFISIQYDSTGDWERIGNITGYSITPFSISIKPRRCDHFRIRLEGTGDMKLYSISKSLKQGSDR